MQWSMWAIIIAVVYTLNKNKWDFQQTRVGAVAEWTLTGNGIGWSCIVYSDCIYGVFLDWCMAYEEERILMCLEYSCNYKSSVLELYQRN